MFEKVEATLGGLEFEGAFGEGAAQEPAMVWELRIMEVEHWGRPKRLPVDGALPAGFLVLSPQGKFVATIGGGVAETPADRENEATFRATFAGAGEYRFDAGRFITRAAHSDEAETLQARDCSLEGNWLEIATSWIVGGRESTEIRRVVFGFRRMR